MNFKWIVRVLQIAVRLWSWTKGCVGAWAVTARREDRWIWIGAGGGFFPAAVLLWLDRPWSILGGMVHLGFVVTAALAIVGFEWLAPLIAGWVGRPVGIRAWRASRNGRITIQLLFLGGLLCVVLLPFGGLWSVAGLVGWDVPPLPLDIPTSESVDSCYVLWEVAVFSWTTLYFIFLVVVEAPKTLDLLKVPPRTAFRAASWIWAVFIVAALALFFSFFMSKEAISRVLAETGIVLVMCLYDIALFRVLRRGGRSHAARVYLRSLVFADLPATLGFLVLVLYLVNRVSSDAHWPLAFVAGAGAFSLIMVNTIFTATYCYESYKAVAVEQ